MKKKLMSVMIVIAMVLSMFPTAFAAEVDVEGVKAQVEACYNWAVANPEEAYDSAMDLAEWIEAHPDEAYANVEAAYAQAYGVAQAAGYIADAANAADELAGELNAIIDWAKAEGLEDEEYLYELEQEVAAAQAVLEEVAAAIEAGELATIDGVKNVAWNLIPELEECLDHVVHALLLAAEDAEDYANAEIIPALEAKAAELEEKWENEWKPALETAVNELVEEAAAYAEAALGEAYNALVEAAKEYAPEVADAVYDYLYNNPDKVIAFVKEYSGDVAAFVADNQEEILAVLGYLAATYGEDVVNFVLENDQEILETMVDWYAVHGDNFEALVLVYLEELGVIDAAEDLYAEIEELLGESIEDIEAAIEEIIAEVEAAIEELEAAAEELKAQLEELKAELENAADEAKAEIEAAIAEIEAAIEEIEAMIEELQAKVEELVEIAEDIYDATEAVIDAVLMAGEDFDAAVAALQEALADLAEAVGAAEEFIAEMNDAIAEAAEWASDAIAALGELAEEIVAGAIEVMETVEAIIADVQDAIEEAAAEIEEAYEAFKQALYDATHETVYGCAIDTYVALGGDAIGSDEDASYVEALAAYVGASEITKLNQLNYFEDAVAYVEENQGDIEGADLITYQMEATSFIVPFINNLMGEIDWTAYLCDEAIAYAEEVKAALLTELAKELDAETLELAAPMAENAVYCAVSFAVETVEALNAINAINPDATVLVVGMYNPLAGLTATVNGEEIAVGEMVEYAMKATDLYYLIYAVATGNVTFVDACGTDINGYDGALDVDAIAEAVALVLEGDFSKYEEMLAAATFIETTVTDVMNSMLTSDEGQDDIYAAIEEALTVESHKWNAGVVTAPTCEEAGYTTYECELCGETKDEDVMDAIGHAWGPWTKVDDDTHKRVCANDASHVETEAHDFTNGDCVCGAKKPAEEEDHKPSGGSSRDWHCPTCKSDTCHSKAYTDLDLDAWYHEYTDYVLCKGMMNGMGDDIFAPNAETTRAMLTTVIYRIAGSPAVTGEMPFADVAEGQWYSDAILWAAQNDVVLGYGDGNFGPMDVITREQIAALFCRFAELKGMNVKKAADLSAYTDADQIGAWAVDYVEWAVATGLMQGRSASTLAPAAGTTRAEAAALLERWCEEIAD